MKIKKDNYKPYQKPQTERNAEIIRLSREEGVSQYNIAKVFDITPARVNQIIKKMEAANDQ